MNDYDMCVAIKKCCEMCNQISFDHIQIHITAFLMSKRMFKLPVKKNPSVNPFIIYHVCHFCGSFGYRS